MSDEDRAHDVSQLTDDALGCRELKHAWDKKAAIIHDVVKGPKGQVSMAKRTVRCRDCGAVRTDNFEQYTFDRPLGVAPHRYEYPDGYRMAKGSKVSSSEVRQEMFRRQQEAADTASRRRTRREARK